VSGGIYLIQGNDQLVEMVEKPYDSESLLQELLEQYPNLLAVNPINPEASRKWLLVYRTAGVNSEEIITQEWSLNRLFLDQQAIPTFVEVKQNRETRNRREMIGQMLEYAANAVLYWPVESILSQFENNCREQNRDPETVFGEFLGLNANEELFWQQVKTNLQAGKVRLIFVSDHIASELQRVVEFLNEQMDPAEVLAVELKQYADQEKTLKTLVSKVIGQTAEAQQKKSRTSRERRQWDQDSFFREYEERYGKEEANLVAEIYQWAIAQQPKLDIQWSTGDVYGGFSVRLRFQQSEKIEELFFLGIDGALQIASNHYAILEPFNQPEHWSELRNKLSSIGLALPIDPTERRLPNFQLSSLLSEDSAIEKVLTTFDWIISQLDISKN
jgi:vacuolar-type H+-ATPase subunit F/Vma7